MAFISGTGIAFAGRTRAWATSLAALLCFAALPAMAPAPVTGSVEIEFTQLRSAKGVLRVCLTNAQSGFPDCSGGGWVLRRTISAGAPRLHLEGLAPGKYALAVIHDANDNAKLDTMLGIPREGFGFSQNPAIRFGPPSFESAGFEVAAGAQMQQVRIRYLL